MTDFAPFQRLLAALGLMLPLLAATAQTPALTAAERAQRDAEKVFSFIKFHTVPARPAVEPRSKPARPPAPNVERAAQPGRQDLAPASAPAAPTEPVARTAPAALMLEPPAAASPAPTFAAPALPSTEPATPEPEPEPDDHDDAALQMLNFVPPVLTPAVQATLGAGARQVKVRFTVEASGQVSHAEAAAGVPRRLAKPATEAILQWQFAPLPQARTVDVEIAFKRD